MTHSVAHDTFTIEREFPASPERVFSAFADINAKRQWFGPPGGGTDHSLDFRVGGRESLADSAPGGGPTFTYDALYQDIVPGQRVIYTYDMTMDGQRISVSVATIELAPQGSGTLLVLTEQGAFLDGLDNNAQREKGTVEILDALGRYLEGSRP